MRPASTAGTEADASILTQTLRDLGVLPGTPPREHPAKGLGYLTIRAKAVLEMGVWIICPSTPNAVTTGIIPAQRESVCSRHFQFKAATTLAQVNASGWMPALNSEAEIRRFRLCTWGQLPRGQGIPPQAGIGVGRGGNRVEFRKEG